MLNKGQETNMPSPPPKKIWLLFTYGGRGVGGGGRRYVKQFFTTVFALN